MKKREKILIGASAGILLGAWFAIPSPDLPPPPLPGAAQVSKAVASADPSSVARVLETLSLGDLEKESVLARKPTADPFAPPGATGKVESEKAPSAWVLQGIFADSKGKSAVLNGEIFHKGEEVSPGISVSEILDRGVLLSGPQGEIKVEFLP